MSSPDNRLVHPLPGSRQHQSDRVSQCIISFGSNLGSRHELIATAAQRINASGLLSPEEPLRTSRLFETPPIGGPGGQDPFLNAAGAFETTAPASRVLEFLQHLEIELGRERRLRWDARSIDLDVILHGQLVGGTSALVVPHPRYTARQFVLQPACDVASDFQDPRFGWTIAQLAGHIGGGVPSLALASGSAEIRDVLGERLSREYGIAVFREPGEIPTTIDEPWLCLRTPELPKDPSLPGIATSLENPTPRLLVRPERVTDATTWPAPHQIWPHSWNWPEYRLEISDMDWAVSELASAIESMHCEVHPVSDDGRWW